MFIIFLYAYYYFTKNEIISISTKRRKYFNPNGNVSHKTLLKQEIEVLDRLKGLEIQFLSLSVRNKEIKMIKKVFFLLKSQVKQKK